MNASIRKLILPVHNNEKKRTARSQSKGSPSIKAESTVDTRKASTVPKTERETKSKPLSTTPAATASTTSTTYQPIILLYSRVSTPHAFQARDLLNSDQNVGNKFPQLQKLQEAVSKRGIQIDSWNGALVRLDEIYVACDSQNAFEIVYEKAQAARQEVEVRVAVTDPTQAPGNIVFRGSRSASALTQTTPIINSIKDSNLLLKTPPSAATAAFDNSQPHNPENPTGAELRSNPKKRPATVLPSTQPAKIRKLDPKAPTGSPETTSDSSRSYWPRSLGFNS